MMLQGVRVLEFTLAWAGPLAGRWLADLGAEVIHLEHPSARGLGVVGVGGFRITEDISGWQRGQLPGPRFRSGVYPDADPGERPWNRQGLFNKMQRNKLSLCLNLKAPGGRDVLVDLVKASDIVLDNFSPRGVRSLGIDYESLLAHNPELIRISLSGYGHTGPDQMHPSWGPILEARTGLVCSTGYPEGGPLKVGAALPDPFGGLHAVVAILAALEERDRTGRGAFIDLSQLETYGSVGGEQYLAASANGEPPARLGNRSLDRAPQGVYPCRGHEQWIAISVERDPEWSALAELLGAEFRVGSLADDCATLAGRHRRHDDIDAAITAWTRTLDRFDAMHELQRRGVRVSALMTNQDLVEDGHMVAREATVEWDQVDVGRQRFPGFPVHFTDPDRIPMVGAPGLGQDNERVLVDILGYSADRVRHLTESTVLATRPE